MIDSLLGLVMLMLLTGWMAGVVSVQAMLSSPARSLTPREQVDVLAAVNASSLAPSACADLLTTAKQEVAMQALRMLLLAPQLMARKNGQTVSGFIDDLTSAGELPYTNPDDLGKTLRFDQSESNDWLVPLSQSGGDGEAKFERLYLCS